MTDFAKMIGKSRGHFSSKENRAQKLIDDWMATQKDTWYRKIGDSVLAYTIEYVVLHGKVCVRFLKARRSRIKNLDGKSVISWMVDSNNPKLPSRSLVTVERDFHTPTWISLQYVTLLGDKRRR